MKPFRLSQQPKWGQQLVATDTLYVGQVVDRIRDFARVPAPTTYSVQIAEQGLAVVDMKGAWRQNDRFRFILSKLHLCHSPKVFTGFVIGQHSPILAELSAIAIVVQSTAALAKDDDVCPDGKESRSP